MRYLILFLLLLSWAHLNAEKAEAPVTSPQETNEIKSQSESDKKTVFFIASGFIALSSYYLYEVGKENDSQSVAGVHGYMAVATLLFSRENNWYLAAPWIASTLVASSYLKQYDDDDNKIDNIPLAQKSLQLWLITLTGSYFLYDYIDTKSKVAVFPSIDFDNNIGLTAQFKL
jgi:hypothetical protein